MSGGSLNYFYCTLQEHIGDFGDKELDELVEDLAELFHEREWYLSNDTGVGSWNEARDAFKAKWFTEHGRQERIEKYLAEIGDDVRKMFGIYSRYCKDCMHFTPETDSKYGACEHQRNCLKHGCDSCDKWEAKEVNRND